MLRFLRRQAYLDFSSQQAATATKHQIELPEEGQAVPKKHSVIYSSPNNNPFRTLPKDAPARGKDVGSRGGGNMGGYNDRGTNNNGGNFGGGFRGRGGYNNNNRGGYNRNFSGANMGGGFNNNNNMGGGGGFNNNNNMGGNFGFNRGGMMGGSMRGGPMGMRGGRGGMNNMNNMNNGMMGGMGGMGGMGMPMGGMPGMGGMGMMGGGMQGLFCAKRKSMAHGTNVLAGQVSKACSPSSTLPSLAVARTNPEATTGSRTLTERSDQEGSRTFLDQLSFHTCHQSQSRRCQPVSLVCPHLLPTITGQSRPVSLIRDRTPLATEATLPPPFPLPPQYMALSITKGLLVSASGGNQTLGVEALAMLGV
jgi:hypothetical protein